MSKLNSLQLRNEIEVDTSHGRCEIQLYFGSVTKLERKDKVDVLVVSAFPDDYSPNPASVIGALQRELGISVGALSKNKEEDLRQLLACWWSHPLPDKCSYERILCFEGCFKKAVRSPAIVGAAFKALISMCKDKDIKVMMPLLTSKDKDYSHETMLRLMVETAIHWMLIGLPLKVLKIVIFARYENEIEENPLLPYFKDLKEKWMSIFEKEKAKPKEHPITYDVYLSYSVRDHNLVQIISELLNAQYPSIRIFSQHQSIDENKPWQEDVYELMASCARVITILSQNYMSDVACLEQYNIALCCSRSMGRDYLAPFYVATITDLPTYMCLIQYIDCRPPHRESLSHACSIVTDWLQVNVAKTDSISETELPRETEVLLSFGKSNEVPTYDVFISYSHQNSEFAHKIKDEILNSHPNWNIFIDVAELKTGVIWQVKLYKSIEASRIVIVLLSPHYVVSKVCQEEYNLSSALHSDFAYSTKLIPLLVETTQVLPAWCRNYTPIDCREMSDRDLKNFIRKIDVFKDYEQLDKPKMTSVEDITSNWRSEHILSNFKLLPRVSLELVMNTSERKFSSNSHNETDIALICSEEDSVWAQFLLKRLKYILPNTVISLPEVDQTRNTVLDDAKIIVPLLSASFTKTAELIDELNIALCRQRFSDTLVLFPVYLEALPSSPAYLRLLWSLFSCTDKVWTSSSSIVNKYVDDSLSGHDKCLCVAAHMIAFILKNPQWFQDSYKTLLSIEELYEASLTLRTQKDIDASSNNPLVFINY